MPDKESLADEIGGRLYAARVQRRKGHPKGYTQMDLEKRSGVAQGRISQIESGKFDVGILEQLRMLARSLDVPFSALLPEEEATK